MTDATYDLIIVGSGVGGLSAAITAKLAGLTVLLAEKTEYVGGSSAMSGGVFWLPASPVMARAGVADTREAGLTYLRNFVPEDPAYSTTARREAFLDATAPFIAMLEEQGVTFRHCNGYADYYDDKPGGHSIGRTIEIPAYNTKRLGKWRSKLRPSGFPVPIATSEAAAMLSLGTTTKGKLTMAKIVGRMIGGKLTGKDLVGAGGSMQGNLLEIAVRLGVEIRTEAGLVGFVTEGDRVTGVELSTGTVKATRGVLVTAGGFAHNKAMREKYQRHPITDAWTNANAGETGEALAAMIDLGADTALMEEAWWNMVFVPEGGKKEMIVADLVKPHGILVNKAGQRFVNEATSFMEVGQKCYANDAVPAWLVMDADARKRYFFGTTPPGKIPAKLVESGDIKQAETVAALAQQMGVDAAALEATVARFNGFAAAGVDEDFHRGANASDKYYGDPVNTPNPALGALAKAPFWAVAIYPGDVGTCGGVVTDEKARVLRADGSPIEGLYAAGNCAAPMAGANYIAAGFSLASAAIFGHIAAKAAAAG